MAKTTVTATIIDQASDPIPGAVVTAKLDRIDAGGGFVLPDFFQYVADVNGFVFMDLWPNEAGVTASAYEITISTPDKTTTERFEAVIPTSASPVDLYACAALPTYPPRDVSYEVLQNASAAQASEDASAVSEANAAASEVASQTAQGFAEAAQAAAETAQGLSSVARVGAETAESNALASELKAQKWATELEDVEVDPGQYSAFHWAQKAMAYGTGQLIYEGSWDASTGVYPSNPVPVTGHFYKISVAGTISGTVYDVGDSIIYNGVGWDKIDNTETVTSVNGRVGDVVITKADIDALNVNADTVDGYHASNARGVNTAVVRDSNGNIFVDDVYAYRGDGTGVIYLGDVNHYLYNNGSTYELKGQDLRINDFLAWHAGNFGKTEIDALNINADTVDGLQGSQLARKDTSNSFYKSNGVNYFYMDDGQVGTGTGSLSPIEVRQNTANKDAFIAFHVVGDYAAYFGLDGTTNDLFFGGWSVGAVKRKIYHEGNFNPANYEPAFGKNSAFNKNFAGTGAATTVSRSDHTHSLYAGYDVAGGELGAVTADGLVAYFLTVRSFQLPASLTGSYAACVTAPSSAISFDIKKNGASVGSINFTASATSGTFTFPSATTFAAGDVLKVVAPADTAGMEDMSFTLKGALQ